MTHNKEWADKCESLGLHVMPNIGCRQDGLNSLGFVAALVALFNPHVLWLRWG